MCGICGILATQQGRNPIELGKSLTAMMKIIAPRGPDAHGEWINPGKSIFLGHQRLSIIGLSDSGAQPMHSSNLRYTISFNGEIYNYKELAQNWRVSMCSCRETLIPRFCWSCIQGLV